MPIKTITRMQALKAMMNTKAGIMRASWRRRTAKKDAAGNVIEPVGTIRHMRFVAYKDGPKKNWQPAGGFFANAPDEKTAKQIKREHHLVVVYPVESEKGVAEQHPKCF